MAETDWQEITALYERLERRAPDPVFTLNRAVALAMFRGPAPGLECSPRSSATSACGGGLRGRLHAHHKPS